MKLYELVDAALDLQEQLEAGEMDEQAFTEAIDAIGLNRRDLFPTEEERYGK